MRRLSEEALGRLSPRIRNPEQHQRQTPRALMLLTRKKPILLIDGGPESLTRLLVPDILNLMIGVVF